MRPIIILILALNYHFLSSQTFTTKSALAEGQIVKLTILETGVYSISADQLRETGIDIENINPREIKLFGNGGGQLPEIIEISRPDDLTENGIIVTGESDGSFDANDQIIFYGEGPNKWRVNADQSAYDFTMNIYDEENYYFLVISEGNGKRLNDADPSTGSDFVSDSYLKDIRHEVDIINLLGDFDFTEGTGQEWYGETFTNQIEQSFPEFNFPDLRTDLPAFLNASFAARSDASSNVDIIINGNEYNKNIGAVVFANIESSYARLGNFDEQIELTNEDLNLSVRYNKVSNNAEGWLNFVQVSAFVGNTYRAGEPYHFYDPRTIDFNQSRFELSSNLSPTIWDVTDPLDVRRINTNSTGNTHSFSDQTLGQLKRYYVFDQNTDMKEVSNFEMIDNQNLHGIESAEFLIVYHKDFEAAAEKLYSHRLNVRPLNTILVDVDEIYNEFSSGKCDPTAIRDFARLLHLRDPEFRFILLMGDGSYDYRTIVPNQADENFIPVYETKASLDPIQGFPSDDYYGLLSDNDGIPSLAGALEVSVGRIPARTADHAMIMVDKVIHYETSRSTLGEWRNRLAFTADDEDSNIHINDADGIANSFEATFPQYNLEKIYFDAFQQESTPGGERYNEATKKINDGIFKGELVLNYLGHGGPRGWAQERVLKISDINGWDNPDRLPLIVTATCSFTGYDDPAVESAGEIAIGRADGGAVALFTTVRAVYASSNRRLTQAVFDQLMQRGEDGNFLRLGDILTKSKNANSQDTSRINSRKFAMIGDPTMTLAAPVHNIQLDLINGKTLEEILSDTLSALDNVTIEGHIEDHFGQELTDFNGNMFLTLFDKEKQVRTLVNDPGSREKDFDVRENVLFKGSATVENGRFSLSFFIPADINFNHGTGKISMYAVHDEEMMDAGGFFDQINIGGSAASDIVDDIGPDIQLFLNDDSFRSGGITHPNPLMIAQIEDDFGINISGTSIGHDLTVVIDDNTSEQFIVNDFYQSEPDNSTKGEVRFPLQDIEPGIHTLTFKAFDIANNSSEATIVFEVLDAPLEVISNIFAYPNPFSNFVNFGFEHDLDVNDLILSIEIFDITGKLVKTLTNDTFDGGYKTNEAFWDGMPDFGSNLANGTYLYRVNLRSSDETTNLYSNFNKLIKIE